MKFIIKLIGIIIAIVALILCIMAIQGKLPVQYGLICLLVAIVLVNYKRRKN
jgi:hypothetical protein